MVKNRPKCCQIAKIFVAITSGKYNYGSEKAWNYYYINLMTFFPGQPG